MRGLWAIPEEADSEWAVLYLFGGGHVITSIHARRKFGGHLARATGCRVMIADYRLAPEHPFPADVDDALAAYRWLRDRWPPGALVVGGESSAAGLTMSTLVAVREAGETLPAAAHPATLEIWPEMQHFFQVCVGAFPEAQEALTSLGSWLRDRRA